MVVDDDTLALDAIAEVGPGGHFFGVGHTQEPLPHRLLPPDDQRLAQLRELDRGRQPGGRTAGPTPSPSEFLAAYEPPPMEAAVREELEDFVARRIAEGGVATDF